MVKRSSRLKKFENEYRRRDKPDILENMKLQDELYLEDPETWRMSDPLS